MTCTTESTWKNTLTALSWQYKICVFLGVFLWILCAPDKQWIVGTHTFYYDRSITDFMKSVFWLEHSSCWGSLNNFKGKLVSPTREFSISNMYPYLNIHSHFLIIFRMLPGMTDHANSFINSAVQHRCMDTVHSLIQARKAVQLPNFSRITITLSQDANEIGKLFQAKPSEH